MVPHPDGNLQVVQTHAHRLELGGTAERPHPGRLDGYVLLAIETERGARMRAKNSAVLASSVFLVCRRVWQMLVWVTGGGCWKG